MANRMAPVPGLTPFQRQCFYAAYAVLSAGATYYMRLSPPSQLAGTYFEDVMKGGDWQFPETGVVLRREYTGIAVIDAGLSFLVAAFLPASSGWTPGMRLQLVYFLLSLTSVVTAMSMESVRTRNRGAVITFTTIWAFFYQMIGGAIIIPLYYVFYTWTSGSATYWSRSREVPLAWARSLLPALILGYVIPTLAFVYPIEQIETIQGITAFWQIAPLLVNAVWLVCSYFTQAAKGDEKKPANADRAHLGVVYAVSFFISLVAHVTTLYICVASDDPSLSLDFVFVPREPAVPSMRGSLLYIFQIDFIGIFAATLLWCYQANLELVNMRRSRFGLVSAAIGTVVGGVILGPGAVISAVFWWRESQIDGIDQARKVR